MMESIRADNSMGENNKRKLTDNGKTKGDRKKVKVETSIDEIKVEPMELPDKVRILEVMEQAQKAIQERKKKLNISSPKIDSAQAQRLLADSLLKNQRMTDLHNKISAKVKNLSTKLPNLLNYQSFERQEGEPTPLILDDSGRTINDMGQQIQLTHRIPTLKANIHAEKREHFKRVTREVVQQTADDRDAESAPYVDPRVSLKPAVRDRRKLKFHDPGEFVARANKIRTVAKYEKLQQEILQSAKRTGISSAVKLAMVAPKIEADDEVPNIEWWDSVILPDDTYVDDAEGIKIDAISNLVEHPIQLSRPGENDKQQFLKAYLTKKEQKKLRRQNRKEAQREQQEKYRLGLEPAPQPKVKISNLMRVLGTSAVEDPTKMEAHVRQQMAKRLKKHEEENLARKLTDEQRSAKKVKKLQDDLTGGVRVAVYRVVDMSHPAKKFKVEMNAKQLYMTGAVVLHNDVNVVVVEGGPKQQKFFKQLMLKRIKWEDDKKSNVETSSSTQSSTPRNKCQLVWEGVVKKRNFGELKFKQCPLEKLAREHFQKHGVEHYWDLAFSGSVLEQNDDVD